MQKVRKRLKIEKKKQETQEINGQYKQGNLNYGVKMAVPTPMNWEQYKKENPNCIFWDYLEYKMSLNKPRIPRIMLNETKVNNYKREKMLNVLTKMEGNDPYKVNLGFNFFHPEQEKSDADLIIEREQRTKNQINAIHKQQRQ